MSAKPPESCPCTSAATTTIEWECARGHPGYAALCQNHGAIHVAALLSGDIRCGRCRKDDGRETAVALRRVNGKAMSAKLGRKAVLCMPGASAPRRRKIRACARQLRKICSAIIAGIITGLWLRCPRATGCIPARLRTSGHAGSGAVTEIGGCQCVKWSGAVPCQLKITQEDLLCDVCRPGCGLLTIFAFDEAESDVYVHINPRVH